MPTYLHAVYCDDVRDEVGGKQTYVGVYNKELFISEIPASIPNLCLVVFMHVDEEKKPDKIVIEVMFGARSMGRHTLNKDPRSVSDTDDGQAFDVSLVFNWSPLPVFGPDVITVRATIDGKEVCGPSLAILPDKARA